MIITESQLRSIVRQVITEEQLNESVKESTLITLSAIILAVAGLAGKITNSSKDVSLAQENIPAAAAAAQETPEIGGVIKKFEDMTNDPSSGFNFVTTIGDNTGGM